MDERRILYRAGHGYDPYDCNQRLHEYRQLWVALKCGSLNDEEVRERVEKLRAVPLMLSEKGYEMDKVDFILGDFENKLLMYKAGDFARIKMVRCGYKCEETEKKVFAYNDLITIINEGTGRITASAMLEQVRQMPISRSGFCLFFKNSYDRAETDAFIAALDSHITELIK